VNSLPIEGNGKEPILCPSSTAKEGSILLGIVGSDGKIGYLVQRMSIDSEFIDIAKKGRAPEKRFRFSSPCVRGACQQWKDNRCSVIDIAIKDGASIAPEELPECSIREQCRWYNQHNLKACLVCPLIVTDTSDVQSGLTEDFRELLRSEAIDWGVK
jgi:hypothetical protein